MAWRWASPHLLSHHANVQMLQFFPAREQVDTGFRAAHQVSFQRERLQKRHDLITMQRLHVVRVVGDHGHIWAPRDGAVQMHNVAVERSSRNRIGALEGERGINVVLQIESVTWILVGPTTMLMQRGQGPASSHGMRAFSTREYPPAGSLVAFLPSSPC